MSALSQITPWQYMRAMEEQFHKAEHANFIAKEKTKPKPEPGVIYAEPCRPCNGFLTYYNNGKSNECCKTRYDYNYFFCEGYDQERHRCDRKHPYFYLNKYLEEEYPCRTIPLQTSSNYGHRPLYDFSERRPKNNVIKTFKRSHGAAYCINTNANGFAYNTVTYQPMHPFMWNAQYGYTYAPPRNN